MSACRTAVSARCVGMYDFAMGACQLAAAPCSSGGVTRPGHVSDGSRPCGGVVACTEFPIGGRGLWLAVGVSLSAFARQPFAHSLALWYKSHLARSPGSVMVAVGSLSLSNKKRARHKML